MNYHPFNCLECSGSLVYDHDLKKHVPRKQYSCQICTTRYDTLLSTEWLRGEKLQNGLYKNLAFLFDIVCLECFKTGSAKLNCAKYGKCGGVSILLCDICRSGTCETHSDYEIYCVYPYFYMYSRGKIYKYKNICIDCKIKKRTCLCVIDTIKISKCELCEKYYCDKCITINFAEKMFDPIKQCPGCVKKSVVVCEVTDFKTKCDLIVKRTNCVRCKKVMCANHKNSSCSDCHMCDNCYYATHIKCYCDVYLCYKVTDVCFSCGANKCHNKITNNKIKKFCDECDGIMPICCKCKERCNRMQKTVYNGVPTFPLELCKIITGYVQINIETCKKCKTIKCKKHMIRHIATHN